SALALTRNDLELDQSSTGQETVDQLGHDLRVLFVDEELRMRHGVKADRVGELSDHLSRSRRGKRRVVGAPDEERRHRELLMEDLELVQARELHLPEASHGPIDPSLDREKGLDDIVVVYSLHM